jgi:hypothetical protein
MNKFIILAQPRTGSTLITSLISFNAPKGVRCINEPINPTGHNHHMQPILNPKFKHRYNVFPQNLTHNNIVRALDICFAALPIVKRKDMQHIGWLHNQIPGNIAAGFKIMAHQIMALKQVDKFWEYLHRNDIKTIVIQRDNKLLQWISDLIVQSTHQCVCWDGNVKRAKVKVPLDKLQLNLENIQYQDQYLLDKTVNLDRKIIIYENFMDNYQLIEDMLPWLIGVKYKVSAKCVKQNPDSIEDRVINYQQLCDKLAQLGLLSYLPH